MSTQEEMFAAIEQWQNSGKSKNEFLIDKEFSAPKFNYWISKWKLRESAAKGGFEPINWTDPKSEKVLEIVTPGGLKISIFA